MTTQTTVSDLKINKMTLAQYATITPSATELYFVTDEGPASYEASNPALTPTNSLCTWTVTHNLGNNISVNVYNSTTGAEILVQITSKTATQVTIQIFSESGIAAGAYKAVVIRG